MANGKSYDLRDIPTEFLEAQVKELDFQPALSLNDIARIIAREWAREQKDSYPNLASLKCTSYESQRYSVYSILHYQPLEEILNKKYSKLVHGTEIYYYKKGKKSSVISWLNDDFRGTMENPL